MNYQFIFRYQITSHFIVIFGEGTPRKTNMTTEQNNHLKVHFVLKHGDFPLSSSWFSQKVNIGLLGHRLCFLIHQTWCLENTGHPEFFRFFLGLRRSCAKDTAEVMQWPTSWPQFRKHQSWRVVSFWPLTSPNGICNYPSKNCMGPSQRTPTLSC